MDTSQFGIRVQVQLGSASTGGCEQWQPGRIVNWKTDPDGTEWVKVEVMPAAPYVKVWAKAGDLRPYNHPHPDLVVAGRDGATERVTA